MRRGLISWSKDELSEAALDARVASLQASMRVAGLDAAVAYTTPARAAVVSWLAGFVPYWNQGLLIVPREGRPILVSALSNRVNGWMRRNAHVADVTNAARIGAEAGKLIASWAQNSNVGIIDLPHVPAVVVDDIATEGHRVSDATALFRQIRAVSDPADIALYRRAAQIAHGVLEEIDQKETDAARLVARIDGEARRRGAEEVYPAIASDLARSSTLVRLEGSVALGETCAVRLSLAYKGAWVRMTRTISRAPGMSAQIAGAWSSFAGAAAQLPRTGEMARFKYWLIEATRSALPLEPLAGSMIDEPEPLVAGSVVTVHALVDTETMPVLLALPMLVGEPTTPIGL